MPAEEKNRLKLRPLRYFSDDKLYTTAYLSQLVQRNRLRAEKIGRNYFTCEKWFSEYLDKHAADNKRAVHKKLQKKQLKNPVKLYTLAVATIAAVFVLFILSNIYFDKPEDKGQVAGEFEQYSATSSNINLELEE